jgi:hypothetical protein
MTKEARIRLVVITAIALIPILTLTAWYQVYKQTLSDQPPFFDLFIAKTFFVQDDSSPFEIVPVDEQRTIDWLLDAEQFETLDTVILALKNSSGEKFYYTSWEAPFTRFRQDLIIYKNGQGDTIPFWGHGCGTGVYLAPLKDKESMTMAILNPLMLDPYSNYELSIQSDSFPAYFKEIYGDSVAIKISQATYSTPWSKYKSQLISSDYLVVSTEKVLDNWRHGKYARLPELFGQ